MNDIPQELPQSPTPPNVSPVVPVDTTPTTPLPEDENKRKERELTFKQRRWIEEYVKSGNATEAAMQVYECKDRESAATIGWENLRKLDYTEIMEIAGITDQKLNQKLDEGLESTKQIGARKIVQGARTGHEIKVDATTDTDDFIDVPDYAIRHKYLETALKLKKRLVDKADVTSDGDRIQTINIDELLIKVYGTPITNDTSREVSNNS